MLIYHVQIVQYNSEPDNETSISIRHRQQPRTKHGLKPDNHMFIY